MKVRGQSGVFQGRDHLWCGKLGRDEHAAKHLLATAFDQGATPDAVAGLGGMNAVGHHVARKPAVRSEKV
jgi:hypothetical protein